MSTTLPTTAPSPGTEATEKDGRRRRSTSSRARIVQALLALVREGNLAPSAAQVAAIAGVGIRSVFRHFDDMETLYREIGETLQAEVLPRFFAPLVARDWRGRLGELVERRIELYEAIFPYKLSGELRRHQSPYMQNDHERHLQIERSTLESVLPGDVLGDRVLVEALMAATGFHAWRILRADQRLGVEDARAVVMRTLDALLGPDGTRPPQGGHR